MADLNSIPRLSLQGVPSEKALKLLETTVNRILDITVHGREGLRVHPEPSAPQLGEWWWNGTALRIAVPYQNSWGWRVVFPLEGVSIPASLPPSQGGDVPPEYVPPGGGSGGPKGPNYNLPGGDGL